MNPDKPDIDNPFSLTQDQTYRIFSQIIGKTPEATKEFLLDVNSLEGKLPTGDFTRPITSSEEKYLEGFNGVNFHIYKSNLLDNMKREIHEFSVRKKDYESTVAYVRKSTHPNKTIATCREITILDTFKDLWPEFEQIFIPKYFDFMDAHTTILTPYGGSPKIK